MYGMPVNEGGDGTWNVTMKGRTGVDQAGLARPCASSSSATDQVNEERGAEQAGEWEAGNRVDAAREGGFASCVVRGAQQRRYQAFSCLGFVDPRMPSCTRSLRKYPHLPRKSFVPAAVRRDTLPQERVSFRFRVDTIRKPEAC